MFARSRDSEEPLGNNESSSVNEEPSSSQHDQDEDSDIESQEPLSESDDYENSRDTIVEVDEDTTISRQQDDASKTSAEFMEEELSGSCGPSPTRRVNSHDVSSSRWSDSEFHSMGGSGEDTPSSTRSLPWGHNVPDCCSSEIISWNRTLQYALPMLILICLL